jgi:hypothetical protein
MRKMLRKQQLMRIWTQDGSRTMIQVQGKRNRFLAHLMMMLLNGMSQELMMPFEGEIQSFGGRPHGVIPCEVFILFVVFISSFISSRSMIVGIKMTRSSF